MSLRRSIALLPAVLATALALAGCTGPKTSEAETALAAGDYDRAATIFGAASRRRPKDAALRSKWDAARAKAASVHAARVDGLVKAGDLDAAELEAETAIYFQPEKVEYRRRLARLRGVRRGLREQVRLAGRAIARKDWLAARSRLEPMRAYSTTFAEIARMWKVVARENYRIDMREGLRNLKITRYSDAEKYYRDALELFPGDKAAAKQLKIARDRARARLLAHEAEKLVRAGRCGEAVPKGRKALELHPESAYVKSVLGEALRLTALDLLAREEQARKAGRLRDSYVLLLAAGKLKPPQRKLKERIANRHGIVAKEIAARYLAHGIRMEKAGLHGNALVHYALTNRVWPNFKGVRRRAKLASAKAASRSVYRMLVMPPVEAKKVAPGGGRIVAAALRAALAKNFGKLIRVYSPADMKGKQLRETGLAPNGILGGKLEELWIKSVGPIATRHTVRYVAGKVPALNPEVERSKACWEQAQARLPEYQQAVAKAEQDHKPYEAAVRRAQADYNRAAALPANTFQQQLNRQNRMTEANGRLMRARNAANASRMGVMLQKSALQTAQRDVEKKLNYYLSRPPYVYAPKYRNYTYTVANFKTTATARAFLQCRDLTSRTTWGPHGLQTGYVFNDRIVAGFPPAGIKADGKDTPADSAMLDNVAGQLAGKFSEKIAPKIKAHGRIPYERALAERKKGNSRTELHYLALAWFAGSALDEKARSSVSARIAELSGLTLEGEKVDPAAIPTGPLAK